MAKLKIKKDGRGGWEVEAQRGGGPIELRVDDSGTEKSPTSVTVKTDDGAGEPSYMIDP